MYNRRYNTLKLEQTSIISGPVKKKIYDKGLRAEDVLELSLKPSEAHTTECGY